MLRLQVSPINPASSRIEVSDGSISMILKQRNRLNENTSQITNASSQMVSAAKLSRSKKKALRNTRLCSKGSMKHTDILHGDGAGGSTNPMLISRPVKQAISSLHQTVVLLEDITLQS